MAINLTCPGCRDAVRAEEADRGKTIKCGTCWSDVAVPPAPAKAAPIPTAKALPTAPIPTAAPVPAATPAGPKKATALPTAAALPAARPVDTALPTAAPAAKPAVPMASKPKDRKDEPEGKKPRFKERDRDRYDDEDDDRPTRSAKKGGGGVMIAFICIGAVLVLGALGAVAVMLMNGQQTAATTPTTSAAPATDSGTNNNNPQRNPGDFNPLNNQPQGGNPIPAPVGRPQGWVEFKGKDFTCDMPGAVKQEAAKFDFATRPVNGTTYSAGEQNDAIRVSVKVLTLPAGTSATGSAFVAAAFGLPDQSLKKDPGVRLVSGHPGVEYTAATADGYENAFLAVGVGAQTGFLFRYQWKPNTPQADAKRDNFLASATILLEADDPVIGRDPFPRDPNDAKPINRPWKTLETTDGFSVDLPPGVKKGERHVLELENRGGLLAGKKWTTDDGVVMYHVYYHDLAPDQLETDLYKLSKPLVHSVFPYEVRGTGEDTKVDGKAAVRWDVREFNGNITHGVSVRVGYRVFTLFVTGMHNQKGPVLTERQDKFLNSIKVTFDPKTHNPYADEAKWVAMGKTIGFTALIPKQSVAVSEYKPFFFDDTPKGKEWKSDIDGITYQIFAVDFTLRPGVKSDKSPADLVKTFTDREKIHDGPDQKAKLGNLNAEGYTLKMFGDHLSPVRFVSNGKIVYVAKVSRSDVFDRKTGDKEFADKAAAFFAGFRLGDQVAELPAFGGAGPGAGAAVGPGDANTGDFVKLAEARVQPFWAGVFLPQKKEFLTFGVKDATARPVRGVLRRYSYPDFKLKATYETPSPINRAAADEASGKLYTAAVRDAADAAMPERENLIASGDVQQFDLNKLTDGTLPEGEQVKPVNVLNAASSAFKVSGLEVAPDGSAVYVSGVTISGKAPRQTLRGKLMKWETAASKFAAEISTDSPVWALALSADGKKVIGLERITDPARPGGNLIAVDGPGWKRSGTTPVTGTPNDVAFRNDRAAVAAGQGKLLVGPLDGDLGETNPGGEASYTRFTPGGTKLLVSGGGGTNGLTLYEVDGAKPPKLKKVAASADLGGLFVVSPDGKLAVMNSGAVLDLERSKAK